MLLQLFALRAAIACTLLLAPMRAHADPIGQACFYGYESGKVGADGRAFHPIQFGAAHWLPLGTRVRVTGPAAGRHVDVTVNDRGRTRGFTD
ncbi:septal ring lytic transglycosylase RlpA family protein [Methylobacterium sp. P31]